MARAYGSSAHLLMKRETTYGQAATGNFIRMPFNRCNLGSEQGLIDDPVLGQGRDPLAPLQNVITDDGDGSFDHEFASGGEDLPSYSIEVGMPKVPAFFVHAGVKLNSIAVEFSRSGAAAATINAIAQGETRFGTTQGGTPTSLTFSRISQFQGSIKRAVQMWTLIASVAADPAERVVDRREPGPHPAAPLQLGLKLGQRDIGRRRDQPAQGRRVGLVRLEHGRRCPP